MKILYFSLVDWHWIKQRPHHIAEGLADFNDVTFICKRIITRGVLTPNRNDKARLKIFRFLCIPASFIKNNLVFYLSGTWFRFLFFIFRLNRFDRIILTYPLQYSWIPKSLLNTSFILYDCMDSYADLSSNQFEKIKIEKLERKIVARSNALVVSSEELKKRMLLNYPFLEDSNIAVINNGVDTNVFSERYLANQLPLSDNRIKSIKSKFNKTVGYIGTITHWIDWTLILEASVKFKDLAFCFVGPICTKPLQEILDANNIFFLGPVEYSLVPLYVNEFNILLYPFVVNDLILAVNPVKVYEYLAMNKPVVSVKYDETLKFADYVKLYNNHQEFCNAISYYLGRVNDINTRPFALKESWEKRIAQFTSTIV